MNTQNPAIDQADEIQQALSDSQALALAGQFAAATMHEVNGPLEAVTNPELPLAHKFRQQRNGSHPVTAGR